MTSKFTFNAENKDSYTFAVEGDSVQLDCYLIGSISGGNATECSHTVGISNVPKLLRMTQASNLGDLLEKSRLLDTEGWRDFHHKIMECQTDSFTWSETNWDE
jgi:hypothetical protein